MTHGGFAVNVLAQVSFPTDTGQNGSPLDSLKTWLAPSVNSGWGFFLVVVVAVLIAGGAFYMLGGLSGNPKHLQRGKAAIAGTAVGIVYMVIALVVVNYVIKSHPS
jgi:hypothetical protein